MNTSVPPEDKKEFNWSGMKILTKGILCVFLGVALLFVKDHIEIFTLRKIILVVGYMIFLVGLIAGFIGMTKHWIEFFKN